MATSAFVGGLVPGVLSLGVKTHQVVYKGPTVVSAGLYGRLTRPSRGGDVKFKVIRSGALVGEVTIPAGSHEGSLSVNHTWYDGNYAYCEITAIGDTATSSPNQGAWLVWEVTK